MNLTIKLKLISYIGLEMLYNKIKFTSSSFDTKFCYELRKQI